jgi:hypothetical protein
MPQPLILKPVLALVLAVSVFGASSIQPGLPVQVHEWGTFTTVAGQHGESVTWAPLRATADLPCFVHQFGPYNYKWAVAGLVRMETPVVYFYSKVPTQVSVHVDFPQGWITEWYPKETHVIPETVAPATPMRGSIDWANLEVLPALNLELPSSKGASRYYAARATDSSALRSGNENERMLFYRGVANFRVPLEPVVTADGITIRNSGQNVIPVAILFENQGGRIGYRVVRDIKDSAALQFPALTASVDGLRTDMTRILEQAGLYPKEAAAMLETWHDSWFEEGTRVMYLMPGAAVDTVLPLNVSPRPAEIQRVFVGRAELLSPWTEKTIRSAMDTGDTAVLAKFNRFVVPFVRQIEAKGITHESPTAVSYVNHGGAGWQSENSESCVQ